ncbi:MAG: T9SS type A sorting domain-containing protein [candidate division KSB1 bacterium]|nr:T9SS type A sorting domain-containing protein [candidate division KSB1 bacterium]MDZ7358324.1 T9SS type A sorting domain-containing protein [candidate division KSB1 bacterium]MDZ7376841.1 T9SS type A sorting domain-containing protein [candidate division KSB1 bacterium]MDZ7399633.1 T9SS type A sorting domain-containing protein [candidate division KSB1 bacterium]
MHKITTQSILALMALLLITSSWAGQNANRPSDPVAPFGESMGNYGMHNLVLQGFIHLSKPQDASEALQKGADRLAETQNTDGGWGWPLTGSSAPNIVGPTAMGLAQAYFNTHDPDHRDALEDAGAFLLTKTNNFSPCDGYLAKALDDIFGGTTYTNHLMTYFYGPLADSTYDKNGAGTLYNTASYVQLIRDSRASQGIANLAAWDIGMGLVAAASVGASTSEWIAGTKAEINELDGDQYYDVIGLAGAVYGLAFVNEDFDPTSGEHAAASSLADLAAILASYQISGGGFTWNSNYVSSGNETIQETAYAILALNEFNRSTYLTNIQGATNYLISVQLSTGGWENYVGDPDGENNEVTGEALWAICAGQNWLIPVELTSFSAQVINGQVVLSWTTATETENLGFHIFRSSTMTEGFQRINPDLIQGTGNSDRSQHYSFTDKNVQPGETYYYKLADVDYSGNMRFHGPISVTVEAKPSGYSLSQNYPNPFNPETAINFSLKEPGRVELKIYNLQGQLIRTLLDEDRLAGNYSLIWNGTNDHGVLVASGTYLCTMQVNGFEATKKLTFMK